MVNYTLPLEDLPDPLPIEPLSKPFDVTITPPGSKSITCRAYVLAALAQGESRLIRPLRADDTDRLLEALCTLGAEARWAPGESGDGSEDVLVRGVGGRFPRGGSVYLGDGGTPTRFMIACACLAAEPVVVDASPRMRQRPIAEGVEMLRQLGATIEYVEVEGRLPVRVVPNPAFRGGQLVIGTTASSQFVSAMMLIAPHLPCGLAVRFAGPPTSDGYIYLTAWTMEQWLIPVRIHEPLFPLGGDELPIEIQQRYTKAGVYSIEPDASSCAYWHVAAAVIPHARAMVPLQALASCQPDRNFGWNLGDFGCDIELIQNDAGNFESTAVVGPEGLVPSSRLLDQSLTPDGAIALAIVVARSRTGGRLTGLRTLRVKETDRIAALASELRKIGCTVETGEDWIEITPPPPVPPPPEPEPEARPEALPPMNMHGRAARATVEWRESSSSGGTGVPPVLQGRSADSVIIETYNDHRMAMAFAVLGLAAPGGRRLAIRNPACVRKSYPTFWQDFAKLYR